MSDTNSRVFCTLELQRHGEIISFVVDISASQIRQIKC